ncbi:B domain-containing protein, partial [Staphylococcus aureus]|uniref:B domain-containing protein n=1 Tax=Staphylococcus aureus TaxID=1280 RepID=UPI001642AA52
LNGDERNGFMERVKDDGRESAKVLGEGEKLNDCEGGKGDGEENKLKKEEENGLYEMLDLGKLKEEEGNGLMERLKDEGRERGKVLGEGKKVNDGQGGKGEKKFNKEQQ